MESKKVKSKLFVSAHARATANYYKPKKKRMATKKKPKEAVFVKKIVKAVVNKNAVLPILEHVNLTGDQLQVTDLETSVIIPFRSGIDACLPYTKFLDAIEMMDEENIRFDCDKNFGIKITEDGSKRVLKLMGENPDQFPKVFLSDDYYELGEIREAELDMLATAMKFVSTDDLRPAMTGVFLGRDIAATDAHRLYWHPLYAPLMTSNDLILPQKSLKILLGIGEKHWRVFGTGGVEIKNGKVVYNQPDPDQPPQPHEYDTSHLALISDNGIIVTTRVIDAKFPDYKCVIPDVETYRAKLWINPKVLREEIKNAMKFGNTTTNQVEIKLNGVCEIHSSDVDFDHEYNNEIDKQAVEFKFYNRGKKGLFNGMRVSVYGQAAELTVNAGRHWIRYDNEEKTIEIPNAADIIPMPELRIAFNGELLDDIISKLPDEPVCMKLWSPTKCTIINDHFLLMPLMLNQ